MLILKMQLYVKIQCFQNLMNGSSNSWFRLTIFVVLFELANTLVSKKLNSITSMLKSCVILFLDSQLLVKVFIVLNVNFFCVCFCYLNIFFYVIYDRISNMLISNLDLGWCTIFLKKSCWKSCAEHWYQ